MACIIKISARKYFKQTCGEKVIIKPYNHTSFVKDIIRVRFFRAEYI